MVRQIIFNDEITLWWEYQAEETSFIAYLNGEKKAPFTKTRVSFCNLAADTEYDVKVIANTGKVLFDGVIKTKKQKNKIDVTKAPYSAINDGKTVNTKALQKALDDCTEKDYVYIPAGTFLSGGLRLHSNTELYLEKDCILQGTDKIEDYLPKIKSRFEGLEFMCYSSLLNAGELDSEGDCNCENIVIRGGGRVVGGGNPLRQKILDVENARLKEYLEGLGDGIKEYENTDTIAGRFRGRLINISNVDNFIISGIGVESSPSWNLHMTYSKNLSVYDCKFVSHHISNGDGIDPDSVENCAIFGCTFDTSDDCIAIKSGRNPEGNRVNRKTTNVYIFDCLASGHSVCVGSEMSGGVDNVYIWDCDSTDTAYGIQVKFNRKRGGFVRNLHANRCKMRGVVIWSPGYNMDGEAAPTVSDIRDLYFEDCVLGGSNTPYDHRYKTILVLGIDEEHPVQNVFFKNITLKDWAGHEPTISIENAENVVFNKVRRV